jgi:hypothetical protein
MSTPLILMLLAPIAGAVFAVSFADFPFQRRILVAAGCAAALAGSAAAVFRVVTRSGVAWRGFGLGPLTAILAAGSILCGVAAVSRAEDHRLRAQLQSALLAATAAGSVPFAVGGVHLFAAALVVSTLGVAATATIVAPDGIEAMRARRALAALAASDVVILVALATGVSSGSALPPHLSGLASAALLAGALIRLGFVPVASACDDAARAHPCLGMLWFGPVRAQGVLLVVFASNGHRAVAYAAAAASVATAVTGSLCGLRGARVEAMSHTATGLAVLGFALGGPVATWGAVLCLAASFLVVAVWAAGSGWRDAVRTTFGAFPAGALLPGAALVTAAAFQAAVARPGFLLLAIPAATAAVAIGAVAALGRSEAGHGDRALGALWAGVALAGALALVAVPARALSGIAFPVTDALGIGRLLSVGGSPGVAENLAAVMALVALVAFVIGPGRTGSGGVARRRPSPSADRWLAWWACAPASAGGSTTAALRADGLARRLSPAVVLLIAASIGVAAKIYVAAAGRGFL